MPLEQYCPIERILNGLIRILWLLSQILQPIEQASRKDTVPIPTPGYTITQSDNPMAIIPRPLLQCFKELNRLFTRLLIIIDVVYESYLVCK